MTVPKKTTRRSSRRNFLKVVVSGVLAILSVLCCCHHVGATSWFRKGHPHQLALDRVLKTKDAARKLPSSQDSSVIATWDAPAAGEAESNEERTTLCQGESGKDEVQERYFSQLLDHFNPLLFSDESTVWQQRYFSVSRERCNAVSAHSTEGGPARRSRHGGEGAGLSARRPIFIYVGGEGPLTRDALRIGMVPEMAQAFNAHLFGLEHRYYGKSHPKSNSSVDNLQWLTSEQALADLGRFVHYVKEKQANDFGLQEYEIPVIVFGCSYPGALAAYFRSKYPAAVLGAVASSSPVEALENFVQYDKTLKAQLPEECVDIIRAATTVVEKSLFGKDKSEGYLGHKTHALDSLDPQKKLTELFGCHKSPTNTDDDKVGFLYALADAVASSVQYNRPPQRPLIDTICRELGKARDGIPLDEKQLERIREIDPDISMEDGKLLSSFSNVVKMMQQEFAETCELANMRELTNLDLGESGSTSARLWTWQTCSEYGFWQTGYSGSVRSQRIDLEWHLRACNKIFPMPHGQFVSDVATRSNLWTGGRSLANLGAATNIHFTNGSADPWANLSVTSISDELRKNQSLSSFVISGASHCRDFGATLSTDESDLLKARREIGDSIRQWLQEFFDRTSRRYIANL